MKWKPNIFLVNNDDITLGNRWNSLDIIFKGEPTREKKIVVQAGIFFIG